MHTTVRTRPRSPQYCLPCNLRMRRSKVASGGESGRATHAGVQSAHLRSRAASGHRPAKSGLRRLLAARQRIGNASSPAARELNGGRDKRRRCNNRREVTKSGCVASRHRRGVPPHSQSMGKRVTRGWSVHTVRDTRFNGVGRGGSAPARVGGGRWQAHVASARRSGHAGAQMNGQRCSHCMRHPPLSRSDPHTLVRRPATKPTSGATHPPPAAPCTRSRPSSRRAQTRCCGSCK